MSERYKKLKNREESVIMHTYGRYPLAVSRASGSRLYDLDGREYIDLLSGIAVCSLGHSHPELTRVMCEQAEKLVHVSNLFLQEPQVELAERLLSTLALDKAFFCNSGAEANEAAIKLARRYMRTVQKRDAYEVVTLEGSFHGRTLATLTATGQPKVKEGFAPLPEGFVTVPWDDPAALDAAVTEKTAAVLVEMVQGEGGVKPMKESYALFLEKLCRDRGVLFMVDEIQSGLCRSGRFWAHQRYNVKPDVVTSAKALANGLPMGAMMATDEAAKGFAPGSHATTFGGGGVLAAVASKVIEIMQRDKLDQRAEEMGKRAKELLRGVAAAYPGKIAEVRGAGLMIGVVLTFPGQDVWKKLLNMGFVVNLTQERVIRLLPPLTVDVADIEAFAGALGEILGAMDQ